MTKSRGIHGPRAAWTEEQLDMLRSLYPRFKTADVAFVIGRPVTAVYQKANSLGLKKTDEYLASPGACRLRRGDNVGAVHRFQKGQPAWNKGAKGVVGVQAACRATQFKPGHAPHNEVPIGSYRYDPAGTLQRKVSNAKGSNSKRWRGVHELVWIEANGPVPEKHIVVFRPGMRTGVLEEITIDRVECISLAENMQRNTRHNLPPELNEVVQLRSVLTRHINKRSKNDGTESHNSRPA
jgi:hypothetical protein